ncbi:hypothetical protein ACFW95_30325 [Streptomyces sp. NPDC059474]|uniref:hypothetical protein n=1 Tax=unclassified Streptomyces TaxID=2593676 RepID=UPI0033F84741
MRAHETAGRVYRRCGCRDEQRRQLGTHCPQLISGYDHKTTISPPAQRSQPHSDQYTQAA